MVTPLLCCDAFENVDEGLALPFTFQQETMPNMKLLIELFYIIIKCNSLLVIPSAHPAVRIWPLGCQSSTLTAAECEITAFGIKTPYSSTDAFEGQQCNGLIVVTLPHCSWKIFDAFLGHFHPLCLTLMQLFGPHCSMLWSKQLCLPQIYMVWL